ncbi:MAG: hypothetical protein QN190_14245 [Armatimonadota bacterium]|nr:hypothetical protein [Armatimonadota bacterium]
MGLPGRRHPHYPFYAPKRGRDGNLVPPGAAEMWFSGHGLRSVVAVSLTERRMVGTVPVGVEPYHVAATASATLFVAGPRVLGTLKVPPRPHGLAVLVAGQP